LGASTKPTYEPNLEIMAANIRLKKNDSKGQKINWFSILFYCIKF